MFKILNFSTVVPSYRYVKFNFINRFRIRTKKRKRDKTSLRGTFLESTAYFMGNIMRFLLHAQTSNNTRANE